MTHREFVAGYRAGKVRVTVNRRLALVVIQTSAMAWYHRWAAQFWGWVWLLSFPAAIALAIWVSWVYGVVAFVLGQGIESALKRSIMDSVVAQALDDADFFGKALETGLIVIREQGGETG